jgi:hypothetical protein
MFSALALAAHLVHPADTLSGVTRSRSLTPAAVEPANRARTTLSPRFASELVNLPGDGQGAYTPSAPSAGPPSSAPTTNAGAAPASFRACVIQHESGGDPQVMNGSGHYGLYQFSASTWAAAGGNPADFGHASVAEQNRVFQKAYAQWGTKPWSGDGCQETRARRHA